MPALLSNGRVDRESLPEGIFRYELRGADYDSGYPLTVEEDVIVNHVATILTAVPVMIPEQGYLRLGDGLNFVGGEQTIAEYLQEMAERDRESDKEILESAIGRNNENLYLLGTDERYAIYQIRGASKGREYRFMGLDFATTHGMAVDAADYDFIYGGRLSGEETLDSLYEKFNLNHPAGYEGHSLSVSDVVVMQKDGQTKAYYVDSFGFQELPDFVRQRLHEAEMNRKREDSAVTLDTSGIEIEQHEGLWHTTDKREIADEIFYLMKHNEYGDSVAAVIVNADGELVAQELENGFDRGAMEAIHEYLAGKGIAWEPGAEETATPEKKNYPPVYRNTLTYAAEHGAVDEYLDSRKLNIDCKRAVEEAIRSHFDGMHLSHNAVDVVLEEYGTERLSFVLACTVQYKETDGRFSRDTKAWAERIPVPENISRGMDLNLDYVMESHPAVLDGFIGLAREKFAELEKETAEPFVSQYYVMNDAYGVNAEREYWYFPDLDSALTAYAMLPNHLEKEVGMESTEQPPTRMSLITCRNGLDALEDIERASLSGKWVNPESREALRKAEMYLDNHDTGIAYRLETAGRYFAIQTVSDGYDYTFYDNQFHEMDGGVYDNPDVTLAEAMEDILEDEGLSVADCKVMDYEELQEKADEAEQEKNRKPLTAEDVTDLNEAVRKRETELDESKAMPLISDRTEPETSLNGQSRAEIEETVLCYAQAQVDEMGLTNDVKLLGARVYGSRTREGLYQEDSDLDVALSYSGNIREDAFFNALHEHGMKIGGLTVDINPISTEMTGTLEAYMEQAEQYLDFKEAEKLAADLDTFAYDHDFYEYRDQVGDHEQQLQDLKQDLMDGKTEPIKSWLQAFVDEGKPEETVSEAQRLIDRIHRAEDKDLFSQTERVEPSISFYVAECMEFPVLGEYHDNLTLEEAVKLYVAIPADRRSGIKGIGFCLKDGSDYDGEYELMRAGVISKDLIDLVPHYKESPLVQKAVADLVHILFQRQEQAKEAEKTVEKGRGTKQSVIQALSQWREKQKEKDKAEQRNMEKSGVHKKGEVEV